jgi:hypothetical protein
VRRLPQRPRDSCPHSRRPMWHPPALTHCYPATGFQGGLSLLPKGSRNPTLCCCRLIFKCVLRLRSRRRGHCSYDISRHPWASMLVWSGRSGTSTQSDKDRPLFAALLVDADLPDDQTELFEGPVLLHLVVGGVLRL